MTQPRYTVFFIIKKNTCKISFVHALNRIDCSSNEIKVVTDLSMLSTMISFHQYLISNI